MNIIACFFVIEENEFTFKRDENEMVRRRSFSNGQGKSAFFVVRKKNRQNWNRRKLNMMKGFKQTIWHALCGCTCTLATWQRSQPFEPVSWTHKLIMKFYTKVTPFHFDKIFFGLKLPQWVWPKYLETIIPSLYLPRKCFSSEQVENRERDRKT